MDYVIIGLININLQSELSSDTQMKAAINSTQILKKQQLKLALNAW